MTLPKLLIFDLDGTLIEFPQAYIFSQAESILETLLHPPVPMSELKEHFSNFDFFRFVQSDDVPGFIDRFWKTFDWANYPAPNPFSYTRDVLQALHGQGFVIALATARLDTHASLQTALEPLGFLPYLSAIRSRAGDHIDWRDKTSQIQQICEELNVDPKDAALIGDIPADVKSAKAAGLGWSVAVLTGGLKRSVMEASEPDIIIEDLTELLAAIHRGTSKK